MVESMVVCSYFFFQFRTTMLGSARCFIPLDIAD